MIGKSMGTRDERGLNMKIFDEMVDEEIVELYQVSGDERLVELMLSRYGRMIAGQTRCLFERNTTRDDLLQEGRIGFFKAMQGFDASKEIPFSVFAQRCVRCQFITAIKAVQRLKHQPLNTALSLERPMVSDEDTYTMLDILTADEPDADPAEGLIQQEDYAYCREIVQQELSPFDFRVFMGYVCGKSYQQIAEEINGNVKSVDNALQRSKRKLRRHIMSKQDMTVEMFRNYLIIQQLILCEKDEAKTSQDDWSDMVGLMCESIA